MSSGIIRIPILPPKKKIRRTPIIDPKLLQIIEYYNKKCAEVYNLKVYHTVSTHAPWNHKNWKYFLEVYTLGTKFDWNFEDYIDAQFARAKKWKFETPRPYPQQLCTPKAIDFYYDYIDEYK